MTRLDTEPTLEPEHWRTEAERAYDEGFTYLDWLTAVDQTDALPSGFDVIARFLDVWTPGRWRQRVLRTRVADGAVLESLTTLHPGAAWHEREVYEMFGIGFAGFEDGTGLGLRRLLLPAGFEGMPLRKSFVLAARAVRPWPGAKEPGEPEAGEGSAGRRRLQAPGVPGSDWGTA
ncbi:MAG: NADH-quinone oxidoreductase subunit C [Dermatophilaceae bacterium]